MELHFFEDYVKEMFDKAVSERRKVLLMFRTKLLLECIPLEIVDYKGKSCFRVLYNGKERHVSVARVTGLSIQGKIIDYREYEGGEVVFKLYGELAQRYTLREHEKERNRNLPDYITVVNVGEDKEELLSRLLRYDKDCEIISPQNYRDELKTMINNMLSNYGEV